MTSLADQESAVSDFMYALQEHQRNCERLGRYTEAEIAKARLAELKQHEESRRRETLRARQLAEVLAVEEAHMMEFQQFNLLQDAKGAAFEQNAQALMDALRARHADELRDFQQRLLSQGNAARHSKEYYTLRDVQEKLAAGRNYAGAAKIKAKADELMAWEEEKHANERQVEMLGKEKLFKQKLAVEAEALKRRIAQGRAEANRARQTDLERILQRYNNVKSELETHQRAERAKLDKEISLDTKRQGGGSGGSSGGGKGGGGGGGGSSALSKSSRASGANSRGASGGRR